MCAQRAIQVNKPGKFYPILILTITLDTEYQQIDQESLPALGAKKQPPDYNERQLGIQSWKLDRGVGAPLNIATGYLNKMGNAGSALETYIYLDRISPLFVFLCGIAGSLDPANVRLGDVVVAKSVDWWQLNKLSSDTFAQAYPIGEKFFRIHREALQCSGTEFCKRHIDEFVKNGANSGLLPSNCRDEFLIFKNQHNVSDNRIHMGNVVSWEYVLSDADIRQYVFDRSSAALAVEMEGAGFAYALTRRCEEMQRLGRGHLVPCGFIFRGISDRSAKKDLEHKQWRRIAMFNAASAIVRYLGTFYDGMFLRESEEYSPS